MMLRVRFERALEYCVDRRAATSRLVSARHRPANLRTVGGVVKGFYTSHGNFKRRQLRTRLLTTRSNSPSLKHAGALASNNLRYLKI